MQPVPRFHLNLDPTGSSAEQILQDRIQTHQENKEELSLISRMRPSPRSMPVWERFWDTSRDSLDDVLIGRLGGLDFDTPFAASQCSLPQLHSLNEDIREELEISDLHTSAAASQGSHSEPYPLDEYYRKDWDLFGVSAERFKDYVTPCDFFDEEYPKDYPKELDLLGLGCF